MSPTQAACVVLLALPGCGGVEPEETLNAEAGVDAVVDHTQHRDVSLEQVADATDAEAQPEVPTDTDILDVADGNEEGSVLSACGPLDPDARAAYPLWSKR